MTSRIILVIVLICVLLLHMVDSKAQNVGIGTNNPTKKLTVNGSIMLDQGNQNNGTLDTAALLFGSDGLVGITSRKLAGGHNGLSFWTGGSANMILSSDGHLGVGGVASVTHRLFVHTGSSYFGGSIQTVGSLYTMGNTSLGGPVDPAFRLRVYDGNTRFGGDMHATGNVAFGGEVDNNYRLRVIGGNSRFGGNLYATGNAAFGGEVDDNYRLRVIGGNSRFGGNVEVTGQIETATLTIGGNGSVRSNGPSSLRIGFDQKSVDVFIANNSHVAILANITDFSGDEGDVRVFVSQLENDPTATVHMQTVGISVVGVNAEENTCLLWIHNRSGASGIVRGTIYLTTIAKN